jgi:hypothetical protein
MFIRFGDIEKSSCKDNFFASLERMDLFDRRRFRVLCVDNNRMMAMNWVDNHRRLNSITRRWTPRSAPRNCPVFASAQRALKAPRSFLENDEPPNGDPCCPKPFRAVVGCSLLPTFALEPQHATPRHRGCLPRGGGARRRHQDDSSVLRPAGPKLSRRKNKNRRALSTRARAGTHAKEERFAESPVS